MITDHHDGEEGMGNSHWFIHDLTRTALKPPICGLLDICGSSALITEENNAFKHHNGRSVVKDLPVNSGTHIRSLARELIFHMPGDQKPKCNKEITL